MKNVYILILRTNLTRYQSCPKVDIYLSYYSSINKKRQTVLWFYFRSRNLNLYKNILVNQISYLKLIRKTIKRNRYFVIYSRKYFDLAKNSIDGSSKRKRERENKARGCMGEWELASRPKLVWVWRRDETRRLRVSPFFGGSFYQCCSLMWKLSTAESPSVQGVETERHPRYLPPFSL